MPNKHQMRQWPTLNKCTWDQSERIYMVKYGSFEIIISSSTSYAMTQMFLWTWGTHCRSTANSSGMVVLGSRRTSLHCGSLGSKKENSKSCEKERKRGQICLNYHLLWWIENFVEGSCRWIQKRLWTDVHLLSAADCSIDSFKLLSLGNVLALLTEGKAIRCNGAAGDQMKPEENILLLKTDNISL